MATSNFNTTDSKEPVDSAPTDNDSILRKTLFGFASVVNGAQNEHISGMLLKLNDTANAASSTGANHQGIRFILIDKPETGMAIPVIVGYNTKGQKSGYFAILMESGLYGEPIKNKDLVIEGRQIKKYVDTAVLWDSTLENILGNELKTIVGREFSAQGWCVARAKLDLESDTVVGTMYATAEQCLQNMSSATPVSVADIQSNGFNVLIEHNVNPGMVVHDLSGEPVHADIVSVVSVGKPDNQKVTSEHARPRRIRLARVAMALDYIFAPSAEVKPIPFSRVGEMVRPAYHPVLIMTDTVSFDESRQTAIETPESNLYGLLALAQAAEKNPTKNIYRRNRGTKSSIGVLSQQWEPDVNKDFVPHITEIDPGYSGFNNPDRPSLDHFCERYLHNTISVAMDIRRGGRNQWTQEIFLVAASDDTEMANAANCCIWDMLNSFTNGHMSKYCERGTPIVQRSPVFIHAGTFTEPSGETRDCRFLTLPEMVAIHGEESLEHLDVYCRSMAPGGCNDNAGAIAIHERAEILGRVAGADLSGSYDRVFFEPEFLPCLVSAAIDAGLIIQSEGLVDETTQSEHGATGFRFGNRFETDGRLFRHNGEQQSTGGGHGYAYRQHFARRY